MRRKYTYEDEKRDALASWLSDKPKLKEEWKFREVDLELMRIKVDIQIVGRSVIKRFRLRCDNIIKGLK